jgi:hypothetical protein
MALRPRLLISALAGLSVLCLVTYASFQWYRRQAASVVQGGTLWRIHRTQGEVEIYREEHRALPKTLDDLGRGYVLSDRWERPLVYRVESDHYCIVSYGLDGKPGGVGLDYDLSTDDFPRSGTSPYVPPQARATFRQFLDDWGRFQRSAEGARGSGGTMALMSGLTGLAAFLLAFRLLGTAAPRRRRSVSVAVEFIITLAVTIYVGLCIAFFHAPTGH